MTKQEFRTLVKKTGMTRVEISKKAGVYGCYCGQLTAAPETMSENSKNIDKMAKVLNIDPEEIREFIIKAKAAIANAGDIEDYIPKYPKWITRKELAAKMHCTPNTVVNKLTALEGTGVKVASDCDDKLYTRIDGVEI